MTGLDDEELDSVSTQELHLIPKSIYKSLGIQTGA